MVDYNIKLKKRLKDVGLTQKEVAERSGQTRTLFTYIMSGRWNLKEYEKEKIAKVLNCSVNEIF